MPPRFADPDWHPNDFPALAGDEPFGCFEINFFEKAEEEGRGRSRVASSGELYEAVVAANPGQADEFLGDLRAGALVGYEALPDVLLDVHALQAALPAETWEQYFGDFPRRARRP